MNKTVSINLGGIVFNFTEEAYDRLKKYLDNVRKNLDEGIDHDEVMADIEASLAEKLNEKKKTKRLVVVVEEVEELIKIMGAEEEFGENKEGKIKAGDEKGVNIEHKSHRMYRNPDDVIVAGVCSGIAAYFNVDPVFVRLIFVLFVFAGGSGLLLYFILMIILPEAKTAAQKIEMRGDPVTVANIQDNLKNGIQEVKNSSTIRKIVSIPFVILRAVASSLRSVLSFFMPFIRIFLGLVLIGLAISFFSAITMATVVVLTNVNANILIDDFPVRELIKVVPFNLGLLLGYISFILPTIIFTILGLSVIRKKSLVSFATGAGLVSLWVVVSVVFVSLSVSYVPIVVEKVKSSPEMQTVEVPLTETGFKNLVVDGRHLKVEVVSGTENKATFVGRAIDLKRLNQALEGDTLKLVRPRLENNQYCILCGEHLMTVKVTATQLDSILAKNNALIQLDKYLPAGNLEIQGVDRASFEVIGSESKFNDLKVSLKDNADLKLVGAVKNLVVEMSDYASLNALDAVIANAQLSLGDESGAAVGVSNLSANLKDEARLFYLGKESLPTVKTVGQAVAMPVEELNDKRLLEFKQECKTLGRAGKALKVGREEMVSSKEERCLEKIIDLGKAQYVLVKDGLEGQKYEEESDYFRGLYR